MTTNKIGPKEAGLRALREARVAANKRLIDKEVKAKRVGKVVNIKAAKRGGRGR
jgi:hypothetical protein